MKKLFTLLLLFAMAKVGFSQNLVDTIGFQSVLTPKYMASGTSTRIPVIFRAKVINLSPNTTYRYFNLLANFSEVGGTGTGAGIPMHVADTSWAITSTGSLTTTGSYDVFTTDNNGEYEGWFGVINSGNATRFTKGNYVHPTISIADNSGALLKRWMMKDSILVLGFSTSNSANDGSGIYGYSSAPAKEIVALYESASDTRPSSVTYTENVTFGGVGFGSAAKFYADSVKNIGGAWGTIIRNNNSNGIRKIERRSFSNNTVVAIHTDTDGAWPTSADTRNANDSLNALFINNADAPLVTTPTITVNQAGFTNDFGLTYPNTPSSGSNFVFSGSNLTDSITITVNAPFEIRVGVNAYASGTIKIANNAGTVNTTVLDARFNPTALGVFTDTIYLSSNGAVTQKVFVKGTSSNNPSISFQGATLSVSESGTSIKVQVNIANANSNNTSVNLEVLGASTATAGADFTFTSPQTITFPANSSDSIVVTIPINDDNIYEKNETIIFGLTNANNGAIISANDTFAVTITDNDYLKVNIGSITKVNGAGVLDSLNGRYEVTGIVYGTNVKTSANGYQLTLRDNTGGVTIFSSFKSYGYSVSQGDSITVKASLIQFNGLAELSLNSSVTTDTVIFHQSNRALRAPRVSTVLGENEENDLVRFNNVTAKPGNWLSGNQYVYINGGADSFQVRIVPAGHSLIGKPKPTRSFSLIGLGGQFDNSSPFTTGYQLFPRDSNDVILPADSLSTFNLLSPADNFTDTIKGASTQQIAFSWEQSIAAAGLLTPTYEIMFDLPTGDFSTPIATFTSNVGGTSPAATLTYLVLQPILTAQGISVGQSLSLKWTARATTTGNFRKLAAAPRNITLIRGVMNSVNDVNANPLTIFPNPANGMVYIEMPEAISNITITTMDGKVAKTQAANNDLYTTINTDGLATGVYTISVTTNSGVYTKKLMIQQ